MSTQTVSSLDLLVPLDGSPLAEQALPLARMLAALAPTSIHLLRVISPTVVSSLVRHEAALLSAAGDTLGDRDEQMDAMREVLETEAESYLNQLVGPLAAIARDVDYEVAFGTPAEQIVAAASRHSDSLIVMATHGKGGLLRWALGSVTTRVLQSSAHPVLVARGARPGVSAAATPALRRIMVSLDGSLTAERALPLATGLARAAHADMLLAQVIDPVDAPIATLTADEATGRLRELAFGYLDHIAEQITRDVGRHVTTTVPVGHVAEEIVDEAGRKHIDLIVLGRHGLGGALPAFLGGTAEKVIQASTVPLLVAG
ncbi:universal stress protein [Oscillochloris sp. ZM17-4]|uniref:universal stress protein n=1 Tax=Oscillochloris sp. ZM17-4 TaxID=2866714 RepID=UPI001C736DE7|nr:universal stress protein [Oscillochloris sp. ZM17-4]MBX0326126.1 universal stress protein [Oscillochloris sp. ZM17-4]